MRSRIWAGQCCAFGQRMSTSPSLAGARSVSHDGQCVGITNSVSVPSRRSTTGPRISGITSPALRTTTVSPMRTPLRRTSFALCSVANVTVDPATCTGSISANGVTRPVRPTPSRIAISLLLTSSGGYLNAIAHRGALLVEPRRRWIETSSTFTTTPSMSCSSECRLVAYSVTYRCTLGDVARQRATGRSSAGPSA